MKREEWPPQREHISELACMALSPAHYQAAYTDRREPNPAMRIGTAAHAMILGGARLAVYPGVARRGKEWEEYEKAHADKDVIVTAPEMEHVMRVQSAVMKHDVAGPMVTRALAERRTEVALEWEAYGIKCSGRIDGIPDDCIFDLKTCSLAEPFTFTRRGLSMYMHAKMAWYLRGARENKLPHGSAKLIAVETKAPYAVTVFQLTPRALEQGDKTVRLWVEKLKNCRASNHWPAYTQTIVDFDVPEDVELTFGGESGADQTAGW